MVKLVNHMLIRPLYCMCYCMCETVHTLTSSSCHHEARLSTVHIIRIDIYKTHYKPSWVASVEILYKGHLYSCVRPFSQNGDSPTTLTPART